MLNSVFELGDTVAREVMVPRTDMVSIDRDAAAQGDVASSCDRASRGCRWSVRTVDDIVGLLYFKDVVAG
jgi:CBS domain containing-hemolysin-like protein